MTRLTYTRLCGELEYLKTKTRVNERLKRDTQHVPLRETTEEKVRVKGLKTVWDDANE